MSPRLRRRWTDDIAPEPRTKKERVLKLEVEPLKAGDQKDGKEKPKETSMLRDRTNEAERKSQTAEGKMTNGVEQMMHSLEKVELQAVVEEDQTSGTIQALKEAMETSMVTPTELNRNLV